MARKKLMKGGAANKLATPTFIFVMIAMFIFFAYAWTITQKPKVVVVEKPVHVVQSPIVVHSGNITPQDQAPVYPRENPQYPLRHVPQVFQQVGVLVSQDTGEDPVLLGLFGKRKQNDRWEYYVASDKYHMWKLPVQVKNRMCDEDVGCEEIYNGDEVVVPDYANKVFVARIYKYAPPA